MKKEEEKLPLRWSLRPRAPTTCVSSGRGEGGREGEEEQQQQQRGGSNLDDGNEV